MNKPGCIAWRAGVCKFIAEDGHCKGPDCPFIQMELDSLKKISDRASIGIERGNNDLFNQISNYLNGAYKDSFDLGAELFEKVMAALKNQATEQRVVADLTAGAPHHGTV